MPIISLVDIQIIILFPFLLASSDSILCPAKFFRWQFYFAFQILECEKERYLEKSCSILGTIFPYRPFNKHPTKIRFIYILNHKHLLNVVLISARNSFAHEQMHEKIN